MLGLVSCYGIVFSTEEIFPNFDEGGGARVCEVPGLVTSFYCNGVVLSTEEILSNF